MENNHTGMSITKNSNKSTLALSGVLVLASLSLPPLPAVAEEPQRSIAERSTVHAVTKEQTLSNLFQLEQKGKQYGKVQAQKLAGYLDALADTLKNHPEQLLTIADDASHPLHSVANHAIGSAYYDRLHVYESLLAIDPDGPWKEHANDAAKIWIYYIEVSNGTLAGRWNFPHGLAAFYDRTESKEALQALKKMVSNAHYARDNFPDTSTWALSESALRSREVAYGLKTQIVWDTVQKKIHPGHNSSPRIHMLADFALGHIDQWFNEKSVWKVPHEGGELLGSDIRYVRPFMVALTIQALLEYRDHHKNSSEDRVQSRIKKIEEASVLALTEIWNSSWDEGKRAFTYTDRILPANNKDFDEIGRSPQADLNMLFAPVFYRVGKIAPTAKANGHSFIDCSDLILDGGVRGTETWGWQQNKQFNQQFFHNTFDYIKARRKDLKS